LLIAPAGGSVVHIGDVAKVIDTYKKQTFITRANGKPAVALAVYKQSTANTVAVSDSVHKLLPQLQAEMPQGVTLSTIFDTSTSTRNSLNDVNQNLIAAVLITGVVLLFFLHNFRSMAIVLLAIPTSLISTYAVMYALGFTLNMLSLMALALLIGILVDDSIVVLENIHRHLQRGEPPRDAALNGRAEIGMAALAITLVDVVVYTPVAYMSGQIGAFFRQFGLTITAATIFSLLVSFTLTPMLASRWLRRDSGVGTGRWQRFGRSWDSGLNAVARRYGGVVAWAISSLRRRLLVIGVAVLLLAGAVALIPLHVVSSEFVPDFDQGLFTVSLEMPVGTPLDATTAMLDRLDGLAGALPETQQTLALAGTGGSGGGDQSRFGTIYVQLKPQATRRRSDKQLAAIVQAQAQRIPGITVRAVAPNFASGSGQPITYRIQGPDEAELGKLGDQVAALIAAVPGTANVKNSGASNLPEVQVQVDQAHLGDLGLTTADVATLLHTALQGTVATQFRPPGQPQVDVRVLVAGADAKDPSTLLNLTLLSPSGAGIPLAQVGALLSTTGPSAIDRYDRLRQVTVSADLTNRTLGDVSGDIRAGLARVSLPPGYKFVEAGSASDQNSAFTSLLQALALSVVLMYMLMVALYESFFTPFVIMFSLPTALVGALIALAVTGDTLNVLSMIGLIMLMGLVAKNAILLVDYTNTLRTRGMPRAEAIRQAGQTRLRPILMTTTAMVLAMLPLALKIGAGAELRSAMGVVLIGGLLSSLLLTLVLVPVMYVTTENVTQRLGRGGRWLMRPFHRRRADALPNGQAAEWPLPPVRQPDEAAPPAAEAAG
jgi:HAE1 family hydrophobic/amphiphilic exporter-1